MEEIEVKIIDNYNEDTLIDDLVKLRKQMEDKLILVKKSRIKRVIRFVLLFLILCLCELFFMYINAPIELMCIFSLLFGSLCIPISNIGIEALTCKKPKNIKNQINLLNNLINDTNDDNFCAFKKNIELDEIYDAYYIHKHYENIKMSYFDTFWECLIINVDNNITGEGKMMFFAPIQICDSNFISVIVKNTEFEVFAPVIEKSQDN